MNRDQRPIIAQCTPSGSGALALLRLSGQNVRELISPISYLYNKQSIEKVATHTIHAGWILDNQKNKLDQVVFFVMDGPKTFTGQDTIEITCHNNPFIIQAIIETVISQGARLAQSGEFTQRAFLNNKIDLVQAEAINELITANTEQALKKSLSQLEGSLSNWISHFEKELIKALAWCEASFEFLDEEMEFGDQIKEHLKSLITKLVDLKSQYNSQKLIKSGIRIALIGSVNAGKSSLFNAILGHNRAIVTPIAGTTRDIIEAGVYEFGTYLTLIDTAGLRQTNDEIEQEGISRSYKEAEYADMILLVFDQSRVLNEQEYNIYQDLINKHKDKTLIIGNKADLKLEDKHQLKNMIDCFANSKDYEQIKATREKLKELIKEKTEKLLSQSQAPYIINKRHLNSIATLESKLLNIIELLNQNPQYELISCQIKDALQDLSELTGKSVSEAGLDSVFKEFCVGK